MKKKNFCTIHGDSWASGMGFDILETIDIFGWGRKQFTAKLKTESRVFL